MSYWKNLNGPTTFHFVVQLGVLLLLIGLAAGTRVACADIPNFAPIAAVALFAGIWIRNPLLAAVAPIAAMLISDGLLGLGSYEPLLMLSVYGTLTAPVIAGRFLRSTSFQSRPGFRQMGRLSLLLGGTTIASSLLFFATTNLVCWWMWIDLYEPSLAGLTRCYAAGLPFFKYTLAGDLTFAALLTGVNGVLVHLSALFARSQEKEVEQLTARAVLQPVAVRHE